MTVAVKKHKEVGLSEKVLKKLDRSKLLAMATGPEAKKALMWLHSTMPYGTMLDDRALKLFKSKDYNLIFNKINGFSARWGAKAEDDPQWCVFGPEIADIEVTTICHGITDKDGKESVCKFCYKANTPQGNNMSLETFKMLFDKFPKMLTQIAFGADSHATSNPDLWDMMEYCLKNGVTPNITVAQISDDTADKLAKYCGAVAVSYYPQQDKNACYDSIKKLTDRGMTQINIHCCIHADSYADAMQLLDDTKTDTRLAKLNAIVFLSLKQKGRGIGFQPLDQERFKNLIDTCMEKEVRFGFDSCSCHKFIESIKDSPKLQQFLTVSEPCESTGFSSFFNWEAKFFPCSFCDKIEGWQDGIQVTETTDFMKDIWLSDKVKAFRDKLLAGGRQCPVYKI